MKRIGVLTSGGDCPGLNAVLRSVVRTANAYGYEVIGFKDGFEGLLELDRHIILDRRNTSGIMARGGTILGTTNRGHFVAKVGGGDRNTIPAEIIGRARRTLEALSIDGLVCIGGDGSLTTAQQMYEAGIPVVGVPKTIDNDLEATEITFGFDSAITCVADALDRLHTTAESHKRVMVVEVMGRHAGWIALYGGLAGGADIILIPEIPFDLGKVADAILQRDADGCLSTMVVVAEGARPIDGRQMVQQMGTGEYKLGGIGEFVAREISRRTQKETRTCVLGHLQRGGAPTTLDRILATTFGVKAVELVLNKQFGRMVSYQNSEVSSVTIAEAVHQLHLVPANGSMVRTARAIGIAFGD